MQAASDTEDGARQPQTLSDVTQCDGERVCDVVRHSVSKPMATNVRDTVYLLATSLLLNHEYYDEELEDYDASALSRSGSDLVLSA